MKKRCSQNTAITKTEKLSDDNHRATTPPLRALPRCVSTKRR